MVHPVVAQIDCRVCEKHSVDLTTGQVNTWEDGEGNLLPIIRNGPPPCESCPKKSPANGERLALSPRNWRMLDFFQRAKAVPQMTSSLFQCPVTQRNFQLIQSTIEQAKADIAEKMRLEAENETDDGRR
jgi:hypothetical protein